MPKSSGLLWVLKSTAWALGTEAYCHPVINRNFSRLLNIDSQALGMPFNITYNFDPVISLPVIIPHTKDQMPIRKNVQWIALFELPRHVYHVQPKSFGAKEVSPVTYVRERASSVNMPQVLGNDVLLAPERRKTLVQMTRLFQGKAYNTSQTQPRSMLMRFYRLLSRQHFLNNLLIHSSQWESSSKIFYYQI